MPQSRTIKQQRPNKGYRNEEYTDQHEDLWEGLHEGPESPK